MQDSQTADDQNSFPSELVSLSYFWSILYFCQSCSHILLIMVKQCSMLYLFLVTEQKKSFCFKTSRSTVLPRWIDWIWSYSKKEWTSLAFKLHIYKRFAYVLLKPDKEVEYLPIQINQRLKRSRFHCLYIYRVDSWDKHLMKESINFFFFLNKRRNSL